MNKKDTFINENTEALDRYNAVLATNIELKEAADEHGLRLTGYSFERELTDYTIASEKEYITQVMIKIVEQS